MSEDFSKGKRGPVLKPDLNKKRITIKPDGDIINHFKSRCSRFHIGSHDR